MVKHTQTIRQRFADELFECVWPFCGLEIKVSRLTFGIDRVRYEPLLVNIKREK